MATIDEVIRMQREGQAEQEIVKDLKRKGVPEREVLEALSQSKIKEAVSSSEDEGDYGGAEAPAPGAAMSSFPGGATEINSVGSPLSAYDSSPQEYQGQEYNASNEYSGMQPSLMNQPGQEPQQEYVGGGGYASVGAEQYQDASGQYPQYQMYQGQVSSDIISEISEQVVSERLFALQDKLEKVIDMKTIFESRVAQLDDRLKRIEKIIDQLHISVLQKMGDYMTSVSDVKKELEETQKSFSAIHHHSSHKHNKK